MKLNLYFALRGMLTHVGFCPDFKFTYKPVRKKDVALTLLTYDPKEAKQNIFCSRDKSLSSHTGTYSFH